MSSDAQAAPAAISLGPIKKRQMNYLTRPVFFVGFMGAGKTSVSRKMARQLGLSVVDADAFLERQQDKKISEIFAESGEEAFRAIETQVLRDLSQREPMLISCGGGAVLREENRAILRSGYVVFLKVTAAEARGRISDLSTRPLFNDVEEAQRRNRERLPLYESVADVVIDTAGKSVSTLAHEVKKVLQKDGVLCAQKE